jgi:hypothetical protein
MRLKELILALQKAKNKEAEVRLTDTEGSFNVGILTVEESQEGDEVVIVAEPHPKL